MNLQSLKGHQHKHQYFLHMEFSVQINPYIYVCVCELTQSIVNRQRKQSLVILCCVFLDMNIVENGDASNSYVRFPQP